MVPGRDRGPRATLEPVLEARGIWRYFGGFAAVQGLDISIARGSAYGFIGPNGAGKSTTLRILATLDRPTAGTLAIDGLDVDRNLAQVRPLIGFMPDPFELYEDLTVEEHLEFFAQAYEVPPRKRRERVQAALALARVHEYRETKCGELSKGWKQRVLLAQTLVHDPLLLLLDEPASGLDPAARIEFRLVIRELRELGKTVVVSSHILTELADFCDSVGIIEHGRMLVSGKIDDILARLDPTTRLDIEVAGPVEPALAVLGARPEVVSAAKGEQPGTIVARAKFGEDAVSARADLLGALVAGGVRVAALAARRENLEDLFLRVASEQATGANARRELIATLGGKRLPAERERR
jgi:ABC-2 type transport system ATP-binding protein